MRKQLETHINSIHSCEHCKFRGKVIDLYKHSKTHLTKSPTKRRSPQVGKRVGKICILPFKEISAFKGYLRTFRHERSSKLNNIITVHDYFKIFKTRISKLIYTL